jgi:hypothetical protein
MDTSATARSDFATRLYDKLAGNQVGKNLFPEVVELQVREAQRVR